MIAPSDFDREVHCILGLPFDAITLSGTVQHIRNAALKHAPCFLSTPNLNFLIASQSDTSFRNSVLNSDLSIADGMPIVLIARLLGIPIKERVAGSTLFEQLNTPSPDKLSVYFFGGMEGVAEAACRRLNAQDSALACAGFESPGFLPVAEMSRQESIEKINASGADFLVVSLGAKKGQAWIELNRPRLTVPIISHLGAVINFVAGTVSRAPVWVQRLNLEWLWRIKEEPGLWRRYALDGLGLLKLLVTRVIPYAWFIYRHKAAATKDIIYQELDLSDSDNEVVVRLKGVWILENLAPLRTCFNSMAQAEKNIRIELEQVSYVDSAFIGLLLLLHGHQTRQAQSLTLGKPNNRVHRIFRYACAEYLFDTKP